MKGNGDNYCFLYGQLDFLQIFGEYPAQRYLEGLEAVIFKLVDQVSQSFVFIGTGREDEIFPGIAENNSIQADRIETGFAEKRQAGFFTSL